MLKSIDDFPGYFISDTGDVFSNKRYNNRDIGMHKLKPSIDGVGYLQVILCKDGKQYGKKIHRLVAEIFIDNPLDLPEVNHKDGIKVHNKDTNLEWCTHSNNIKHAFKNGYISIKLTMDQAIQIRELYATGKYLQKELGMMFNIDKRNIGRIINNQAWQE